MAELTSAIPPSVRATDIPRTWWNVGKDTFAALNQCVASVAQGIVGLPVDALNVINQFNPAHLTPASWGCARQCCPTAVLPNRSARLANRLQKASGAGMANTVLSNWKPNMPNMTTPMRQAD